MVILQVMKITGQPPPFPHAEGVAHQKKSFVLTAPPRCKRGTNRNRNSTVKIQYQKRG